MYGVKTPCDFREDCIKRDSTVCNICSRSKLQKHDYFQQDIQVISNIFTESIKNRFGKAE